MEFRLHSEYTPTGDQPQAIESICCSIESGNKNQSPKMQLSILYLTMTIISPKRTLHRLTPI